MIFTSTGLPTSTLFPVGVSSPVFGSMRKDNDAVGILIGDHGPRPRWIDAEAARHLDPFALIRHVGHQPGFWINGESHNAVLAAIGAEHELARRIQRRLPGPTYRP